MQNSGFVVTFGASPTGFTVESYDTGNIHDPAAPEVLRAPQTGSYLVSAELNFDPDIGYRTAGFAIDGTTCCGRVQTPAVSGSNTLVAPTAIMALNQGEKVTLRVTVTGAASNVNVRQAKFAMHWLGPIP